MAENGQGAGGNNAPGDGLKTQSLNHGPGSFTQNNADQLPGEPTKSLENTPDMRGDFDKSRDPLIARQIEDQGKTEAQRRNELTGQGRAQMPKGSRQKHAPAPAPGLRPDNAKAVDRGSFAARQRDEDYQARKDQFVASRRANLAQKSARNPSADKESFRAQFRNAAFNDNQRGRSR